MVANCHCLWWMQWKVGRRDREDLRRDEGQLASVCGETMLAVRYGNILNILENRPINQGIKYQLYGNTICNLWSTSSVIPSRRNFVAE